MSPSILGAHISEWYPFSASWANDYWCSAQSYDPSFDERGASWAEAWYTSGEDPDF